MMDRQPLLDFARTLTRDRAGFLPPPAMEAVEMRLGALARREGLASAWVLLAAVRKQPGSALAADVVEALAPRDTWFFRDRTPFQTLAAEVLPAAMGQLAQGVRLRVWCAGCGAGQEAYSIAMLLEERRARGEPAEADIVATDLSRSALKRAADGLYDQFEIQRGLSIHRLIEHFEKDGENWRVNRPLRRTIDFRLLNLTQDFSGLGEFDIVLLRHVLPHLAGERRDAILRRVGERVRPGGWLMLGAWEDSGLLLMDCDPVHGVDGLYRKRDARVDRRLEPRTAAA